MKTAPFVVTPGEYARALNVVGEKITVLASKGATHGYEIFLQQGDEGTGPPPHSHDWDESFYVVRGNIEIRYEDQTVIARPGTLVHLPQVRCTAFNSAPAAADDFGHRLKRTRLAALHEH